MKEASNRNAYLEDKEERSVAGISWCNDLYYFLCDNRTEYNDPRGYQIPDVPQVTGLDIRWFDELDDY